VRVTIPLDVPINWAISSCFSPSLINRTCGQNQRQTVSSSVKPDERCSRKGNGNDAAGELKRSEE